MASRVPEPPAVASDLSAWETDSVLRWWKVVVHLLAAAFLALTFYALLVHNDLTTDGSVMCGRPIDYISEPRPVPVNDGIAPDFGPYCWDSAQRQIRASAALLSVMGAAWIARSIVGPLKRRGHLLAGIFVLVGVVALVGDFFWLFA